MGSSGREALTFLAVMKKFHGSSVPRPRMKKISQTALYLRRGQSGLEWDAGQGRRLALLLAVPSPTAGGTRRRKEEEIYCPVSAPAPQPLVSWAAGDVALQRGCGRPSPVGYEGRRKLVAPQHVAPRCTAAISRAGRQSRSPGVSQRRGLFTAHLLWKS